VPKNEKQQEPTGRRLGVKLKLVSATADGRMRMKRPEERTKRSVNQRPSVSAVGP
jgi:hypothetical protein